MQTSVRIIGAVSPDGSAPPVQATQAQVAVSSAGHIYVDVGIGPSLVLTGVGNDSEFSQSSSPTNIPCVSFGYAVDRFTSQWAQLQIDSNALGNMPVDAGFVGGSLKTLSFDYVYSVDLDQYLRPPGASNGLSLAFNGDFLKQEISFPRMFGVDSAGDPGFTTLHCLTPASYGDAGRSLQVMEVLDAPISATNDTGDPLTVGALAGGIGNPVRVSGIAYSLSATVAQAVPVLVELVEDIGGAANVVWRAWVTAAAGAVVDKFHNCNITCNQDATLRTNGHTATNNMSITLVANSSIGNGRP